MTINRPVSEVFEAGHWRAECVCTIEYYNEPFVDDRVRLDPLDPKTSRHVPQCEYAAETDSAVLRLILRVKDGADPSYKWVECGGCDCGWPVSTYAEKGRDRS